MLQNIKTSALYKKIQVAQKNTSCKKLQKVAKVAKSCKKRNPRLGGAGTGKTAKMAVGDLSSKAAERGLGLGVVGAGGVVGRPVGGSETGGLRGEGCSNGLTGGHAVHTDVVGHA